MKEMYEIVGQMIVSNADPLYDPRSNAFNNIVGAVMASNLIELRILPDGVLKIHEYLPAEKAHLTPLEFAQSLEKFLNYDGISELGFEGEFIFIRTTAGKEPLMSKIILKENQLTLHEAEVAWKAND